MDYIDTRDLMEEWDALEPEVTAWAESTEAEREAGDVEYPGLESIARYEAIGELRDELGEQTMRDGDAGPLIPVSDFTEYAQELAEDCGMVSGDHNWPNYCIDWEYAARELAMDYGRVSFEGTDYYYRYC